MLFIIKRGGVWNKGKLCMEGESIELDPVKDMELIADGTVVSAKQLKLEADDRAEEAAQAKAAADAAAAEEAAQAKAAAQGKKGGGK